VIRIGEKHPVFYMNIVKGLLANNKHEVIELHGMGERSIVKLTIVMRLLLTFKYCDITRIKTGTMPAPVLKVSFKKSATFQTSFDDYQKVMLQRKEEREKAAAAKKEQAVALQTESAATVEVAEV
jgi:hypothetical protein